MKYLLLSFKRGAWGNSAVWWGSDGTGYTSRIDRAGRYGEEAAKEIERLSPFDRGSKDTVAVPEQEALAESHRTVDFGVAVARWKIAEEST